MKRELYLIDDYSYKFWDIEIIDVSCITRYGKIGTEGTTKQKEFKDQAAAQKQLEKQVNSKLNKGYIEVSASNKSFPEKLHAYAQTYNWDYGFGGLYRIINSPECDKGTALLIYWLSAPRYFCQYEDRSQIPGHGLGNYDFVKKVEENYLSGFYQNSEILFNPQWDRTTISSSGYDWTKEYQDEKQKNVIPESMEQPSKKDPEWEEIKRTGTLTGSKEKRLK